MSKPLQFFLGANTPQGFVSRFDQLADADLGWRQFVIKGGPGTGKSTMMKKIVAAYQDKSSKIEQIHCSSDVDSLDGVIIHDIKTSIADGTSPHVIEPKYPGAFEQLVDLSVCWDENKLFECREEIMDISRKISRCHEHCCRFLGAAGSLLSDTYRIALEATMPTKVKKAAARIVHNEFRGTPDGTAKESVRFISAVTNKGCVMFSETANTLCDRIWLIDDAYGASSRLLLGELRTLALEGGWDIITCYCPLSPFEKIEHLFIPSLRIGFMTQNLFMTPDVEPYKIIRSRRFTDPDLLKKSRKRIAFNKKAATHMIERAAALLAEAKNKHDILEDYYVKAMDFAKVNAVSEQTLAKYEALFQKQAQ